jgi:hypothetical protein
MSLAARPETPQRTVGPALEAMNRFPRWLIPTVEKFPRTQKFLLGDRIQSAALDVLERLIEATYDRDRGAALRAASDDQRRADAPAPMLWRPWKRSWLSEKSIPWAG